MRLAIVAAGALEYLPWGALPTPLADGSIPDRPEPLVAGHEIVHLPSASVLADIRRALAGRSAAPRTVAILPTPSSTAKTHESPRPTAASL
jgi:hypothetical protein